MTLNLSEIHDSISNADTVRATKQTFPTIYMSAQKNLFKAFAIVQYADRDRAERHLVGLQQRGNQVELRMVPKLLSTEGRETKRGWRRATVDFVS